MNKPLTPLELQLQQYMPDIYILHKLMQDVIDGGGGEKKLILLIDTLLKYHQTGATGAIMIDYSNGKIANIDTRLRITAGTAPKNNY